jgi:serine/threonine protein kinase
MRGATLAHTRIVAYQILKALEIIHSIGIIHSDLKVLIFIKSNIIYYSLRILCSAIQMDIKLRLLILVVRGKRTRSSKTIFNQDITEHQRLFSSTNPTQMQLICGLLVALPMNSVHTKCYLKERIRLIRRTGL